MPSLSESTRTGAADCLGPKKKPDKVSALVMAQDDKTKGNKKATTMNPAGIVFLMILISFLKGGIAHPVLAYFLLIAQEEVRKNRMSYTSLSMEVNSTGPSTCSPTCSPQEASPSMFTGRAIQPIL